LRSPGTKILVLSDLHYPQTDITQILDIINQELPDKVIFLGDTIQRTGSVEEFDHLIRTTPCNEFAFILGDDDPPLQGERSLYLELGGRKFLFIHGFQYNLSSEENTRKIATALRRIHRDLPVLGFAIISKIRSRSFKTYLILGHSHALKFFPKLKVACAGCLTTEKNVYNDRGYLVIEATGNDLTLSVRKFGEAVGAYKI
jgi:uncharacterized protein